MNNENTMLVNFEQCKTCKFYGTNQQKEPCDECLSVPARESSHKPINWKTKE